MSLLRVLRNLALLVILTVAGLSLSPRPVAAQSCRPLGTACTRSAQCCSRLCGWHHSCCSEPFRNQYCTSWKQCCSALCLNNRCQ